MFHNFVILAQGLHVSMANSAILLDKTEWYRIFYINLAEEFRGQNRLGYAVTVPGLMKFDLWLTNAGN